MHLSKLIPVPCCPSNVSRPWMTLPVIWHSTPATFVGVLEPASSKGSHPSLFCCPSIICRHHQQVVRLSSACHARAACAFNGIFKEEHLRKVSLHNTDFAGTVSYCPFQTGTELPKHDICTHLEVVILYQPTPFLIWKWTMPNTFTWHGIWGKAVVQKEYKIGISQTMTAG